MSKKDIGAMPETTAAPSRTDAERAAALLMSAGVSKVMLFGSLARGEATERSDIDLVAIYDDLDYTERFTRKAELSTLVEAEVDHPVDLVVTDRPEWKIRSEQVLTSLESWVEVDGVVLADRGAGRVDWEKEMVIPTNGREAAVRRLREVSNALRTLNIFLKPDDAEIAARESGDRDEFLYLLAVRQEGACGQVQRTIESAVKALAHAAGRRRELRGHDIGRLCGELIEPHRNRVGALVSAVGADEITRRREDSRYTPDRAIQEPPAAEQIQTAVKIACRVARYTVEQFDESMPNTRLVRQAIIAVENRLTSCDIETGDL